MFGAIEELLAKTRVNAKDIGSVIVNCGSFHTTPSHSAAVMNPYSLRCDVLSYSLGGMGCSAGCGLLGVTSQWTRPSLWSSTPQALVHLA
ncbi:hypothetical protein RJ640_011523 [Escallonia rubra]|uniref:FAE domain-containing protein n=1 Tax=Escallonia rubra TaxID=112253 RepID=A0AA88RG19_9ASTE|nr:hypothetical protein RJ640_011523 [Escallonia rubra]